MFVVATHFGYHDLSWIPELAGDDYFVYDRSGNCGLPNSVPRENIGDADLDRLSYIIDNYHDLPDVFMLTKSNIFKYISKGEFDVVKNNQVFTPLLTQNHRTYNDERGNPVCFYQDGMYHEVNNSFYLNSVPARYFSNWAEWAKAFYLPNPAYLPFAPGGNYILTKERVHRYAVDYYDEMRSTLPYSSRPGEAQLVERSLYLLWR